MNKMIKIIYVLEDAKENNRGEVGKKHGKIG